MKQQQCKEGKQINIDKLYINGQLYRDSDITWT